MSDEVAGFPSQERGVDPVIGRPGSNQWLGHQANHHDGVPTKGPHANRLLPGTTPEVEGPSFGAPSKVNPLGHRFPASLEDN